MRRANFTLAMAMTVLASIGSLPSEAVPKKSGYWFLSGCGRGSCWPEVDGFLKRSRSARLRGFGKPRWCLPKLVTYHVVAQDFRDFLRERPSVLGDNYEVLLETMLFENYPCVG
jgi:hypothetical protein